MLTLVVAALVLVLPAQAFGLIVIGGGVDRVAIGMTQSEAEKAQGLAQVIRAQDPLGNAVTIFDWGSFEGWIEAGNTITRLVVTKKAQRTFLGVGVGTKLAKLKSSYAGVLKCRKGPPQVCTIGRPKVSNTRVTEFEIRNGRVSQVTIRLVP